MGLKVSDKNTVSLPEQFCIASRIQGFVICTESTWIILDLGTRRNKPIAMAMTWHTCGEGYHQFIVTPGSQYDSEIFKKSALSVYEICNKQPILNLF